MRPAAAHPVMQWSRLPRGTRPKLLYSGAQSPAPISASTRGLGSSAAAKETLQAMPSASEDGAAASTSSDSDVPADNADESWQPEASGATSGSQESAHSQDPSRDPQASDSSEPGEISVESRDSGSDVSSQQVQGLTVEVIKQRA